MLNRYRYALKGFAARFSDEQVEALKNDPRIATGLPKCINEIGEQTNETPPITRERRDCIQPAVSYPVGMGAGIEKAQRRMQKSGSPSTVCLLRFHFCSFHQRQRPRVVDRLAGLS